MISNLVLETNNVMTLTTFLVMVVQLHADLNQATYVPINQVYASPYVVMALDEEPSYVMTTISFQVMVVLLPVTLKLATRALEHHQDALQTVVIPFLLVLNFAMTVTLYPLMDVGHFVRLNLVGLA